MSKSTTPVPGDQQVVQTNLPPYVEPFFTDLLERTQAVSEEAYQPYEGQRIAGVGEDITGARRMARDIAGQGLAGIPEATAASTRAMQEAFARSGYGPYDYQSTAEQFGFDPAERFGGAVAQEYMSPYMQQVVDVQKEQAILDAQRAEAGRAAQAVQAGAFGGSRQAVQEALAGEALGRQLGEIQAAGSQQAFEQAQMQFERDRAARMGLEQQQAAEAARVQQQLRTEQEQEAAERMQAAKFGLGAAELGAGLGLNLAQLGERARAGDVQAAQLLETVGKDVQEQEQRELDLAYQDFVRQRDYPREQLQFLSSILRGVPVSPSTESQTIMNVNPLQQALGTGIAGLGLYRGLTG